MTHYCMSTADIPDGVVDRLAEEMHCGLDDDCTPEVSAAFVAALDEYRCGKPALFCTGGRVWLCAEHWDRLMVVWREALEDGTEDEEDIAEMKEVMERYGS